MPRSIKMSQISTLGGLSAEYFFAASLQMRSTFIPVFIRNPVCWKLMLLCFVFLCTANQQKEKSLDKQGFLLVRGAGLELLVFCLFELFVQSFFSSSFPVRV